MHSGRGVCGLQQVRSVAVFVFGFECHNGTMPAVCMVVALFLLGCSTAMKEKVICILPMFTGNCNMTLIGLRHVFKGKTSSMFEVRTCIARWYWTGIR